MGAKTLSLMIVCKSDKALNALMDEISVDVNRWGWEILGDNGDWVNLGIDAGNSSGLANLEGVLLSKGFNLGFNAWGGLRFEQK